jgi:succinate-acetate transporter protein
MAFGLTTALYNPKNAGLFELNAMIICMAIF